MRWNFCLAQFIIVIEKRKRGATNTMGETPLGRLQVDEKESSLTPEVLEQWFRIGERFYSGIPAFREIWNATIKARGPRRDDHPISRLSNYLDSFANTGQQALYAMEQLEKFSRVESSNTYEFYVRHYFHDFIGRIKTATDLLALTINHLFELKLSEKSCSLENNSFRNTLRGYKNDNVLSGKLFHMIDTANSDWISAFYDFRNLVIHRAALRFTGMAVPDAGDSRTHIMANDMLRIPEEKKVLDELLGRFGENSISRYGTVDPQKLSEEIWNALAKLSEELMGTLTPKVEEFLSVQQ